MAHIMGALTPPDSASLQDTHCIEEHVSDMGALTSSRDSASLQDSHTVHPKHVDPPSSSIQVASKGETTPSEMKTHRVARGGGTKRVAQFTSGFRCCGVDQILLVHARVSQHVEGNEIDRVRGTVPLTELQRRQERAHHRVVEVLLGRQLQELLPRKLALACLWLGRARLLLRHDALQALLLADLQRLAH